MIEGLHVKGRPRAARVALKTPKLSRKPRTVAMIKNADTAKRLSLHARMSFHLQEPATVASCAWRSWYHISAEPTSSSAVVLKAAVAWHLKPAASAWRTEQVRDSNGLGFLMIQLATARTAQRLSPCRSRPHLTSMQPIQGSAPHQVSSLAPHMSPSNRENVTAKMSELVNCTSHFCTRPDVVQVDLVAGCEGEAPEWRHTVDGTQA